MEPVQMRHSGGTKVVPFPVRDWRNYDLYSSMQEKWPQAYRPVGTMERFFGFTESEVVAAREFKEALVCDMPELSENIFIERRERPVNRNADYKHFLDMLVVSDGEDDEDLRRLIHDTTLNVFINRRVYVSVVICRREGQGGQAHNKAA